MDEMLAGNWTLSSGDAPPSLAMPVTFDDGVVREHGLPVGRYLLTVEGVVIQIGQDVTVTLDGMPLADGGFAGAAVSRNDDETVRERAVLRWDGLG